MPLTIALATAEDASAIAAVRNAAADRLTEAFGRGAWSSHTTEKGVVGGITNTSHTLVARNGTNVVGTLRLATKKPWAIDVRYFTPVRRPLYLLDMAVAPESQRQGIGRALLAEAVNHARAWPADALRLDAFDSPAGAGPFYAKCGYREVGRVTYRGTPLVYYEMVLGG